MRILQTIKLLLPALIPSWNFFDVISSSPRIQYILLGTDHSVISDWQEFRPRPKTITSSIILKRMIWNPTWNESLFLVSCAERLMENYTQHSEDEILNRIGNDFSYDTELTYLQFRLEYVVKKGTELNKEIMFTSRIHEIIR